jgi:hypothetical protein
MDKPQKQFLGNKIMLTILKLVLELIGMFLYVVNIIVSTLSMIAGVFIYPFIFKFYVVPKIEKKIGQRTVNQSKNYYPKIWSDPGMISFTILILYFMQRKYKEKACEKVQKKYASLDLVKKNYRYEMVERPELVWSFIVLISGLWFFIGGGILLILSHFGIPAFMQDV